MITKYIKGDICDTELKYIAHGVNTQNKMGSGVAKALYTRFPEVKTSYHDYINSGYKEFQRDPEDFLGDICGTYSENGNKYIFNFFTQVNYGYDGKKYVNYAAVSKCFRTVIKGIGTGKTIAIPKIGCGLGGGDWTFIEQLINDTVGDDLEIWVYELP